MDNFVLLLKLTIQGVLENYSFTTWPFSRTGVPSEFGNGFDHQNQELVLHYLKTSRPGLVLIAPPCELYSQLQNLSKNARDRDPKKLLKFLKRKRNANKLRKFAIGVEELCHKLGLTFVLEHPWSATSWTTKMMERLRQNENIYLSRCDQCMFGLHTTSGHPCRKRTGFATNNKQLAEAFEVHCSRESRPWSHAHHRGYQLKGVSSLS